MFFIDDPEFVKHGYYTIDGIKTFSKYEAYQLSGENFDNIKFVFNDDEFAKYDWSVEPQEDVYELFAQRARQLREKYDYIVLMYSGGIDSHTILETFLNNGIYLNEICSFGNPEIMKKEKLNQEVFNAAIPFIETLDLKKMNTKFRFVDISRTVIEQHNDPYHFENFEYYGVNATLWRTTVNSYKFKSQMTEHIKLAETGKKICYVWGLEKPGLSLVNGEWCARFIDNAIDFGAKEYNNRVIFRNQFQNFYDEAFFSCREFPQITIKQSHMLVNMMKQLPADHPGLKPVTDIPVVGPYIQYNESLFLSKKLIDGCIYPGAMLNRFLDDKLYRGSPLFSRKDDWFFNSNHENLNKYKSKMHHLIRTNRDFFRFKKVNPADPNSKDFVFSIKPVYSKFYPIGKK
jgi:hypothetical protein